MERDLSAVEEFMYEAVFCVAPRLRYMKLQLSGRKQIGIAYGVIADPYPKLGQIDLIPFAYPEKYDFTVSDALEQTRFSQRSVKSLWKYLPEELLGKKKIYIRPRDLSIVHVRTPDAVAEDSPDYKKLLIENTLPSIVEEITKVANRVENRLIDLPNIIEQMKTSNGSAAKNRSRRHAPSK
jgi:hypothetical protein